MKSFSVFTRMSMHRFIVTLLRVKLYRCSLDLGLRVGYEVGVSSCLSELHRAGELCAVYCTGIHSRSEGLEGIENGRVVVTPLGSCPFPQQVRRELMREGRKLDVDAPLDGEWVTGRGVEVSYGVTWVRAGGRSLARL